MNLDYARALLIFFTNIGPIGSSLFYNDIVTNTQSTGATDEATQPRGTFEYLYSFIEKGIGLDHHDYIVATDGSYYKSTGDCGFGVYYGLEDSRNIAAALPKGSDSYTAELIAILKALDGKPDGSSVLIFTDCQSAIDSIHKFGRVTPPTRRAMRWHFVLNEICEHIHRLGTVTMAKIPAHKGIAPNVAADCLAKSASNSTVLQYTFSSSHELVTFECKGQLINEALYGFIENMEHNIQCSNFLRSENSDVRFFDDKYIDFSMNRNLWYNDNPDQQGLVMHISRLVNRSKSLEKFLFQLQSDRTSLLANRMNEFILNGDREVLPTDLNMQPCPSCTSSKETQAHWIGHCKHSSHLRVELVNALDKIKEDYPALETWAAHLTYGTFPPGKTAGDFIRIISGCTPLVTEKRIKVERTAKDLLVLLKILHSNYVDRMADKDRRGVINKWKLRHDAALAPSDSDSDGDDHGRFN